MDDSLIGIIKMQWFLYSKQYAVYSHDLGGNPDSPVNALYSHKNLPRDAVVVEIHPKKKWRVFKVIYWSYREYRHEWRSRRALPLKCGCTEYKGKRYLFCTTDHMMEELESRRK